MAGSAKAREFVTLLITDGIDSATLDTELELASNLVDFIMMFSYSTTRRTVLTDSNAWNIIRGSAVASNSTIYRHTYLGSQTGAHMVRFNNFTQTNEPFFELSAGLAVDAVDPDHWTLLSCLAGNTLFIASVDAVNEDMYMYGLNFTTSSFYYTGAFLNDTEDQGMTANTWSTHEGYIFGGSDDAAECDELKVFSFFSEVLFEHSNVLQDQKQGISGFHNVYKSFIAGGFDDSGNRETKIESMLHSTHTFTVSGSSLSPGVSESGAAESNTAGYLFGGDDGAATEEIQKIVMSTETVSIPVNLITADRDNVATRTFDQIYLFGGSTDTGKTYKYDTNDDTVAPADQSIVSIRYDNGAEGF